MTRPSCIQCVQKHLAQAAVLLMEARLGYPLHRVLAWGHMAEAECECLQWHGLAISIREERVRGVENPDYDPDMMALIERAVEVEAAEDKPKTKKK